MKIDLHVHTSEISCCGKLPGKEIVRLYAEAGYDAIVLTNHFESVTAEFHAKAGHPAFDKYYFEQYEKTAAFGKESGLLVLCGAELRFTGSSNDYLVYGMPREFFARWRELFTMTPETFGELARKNDFLFYQAHPFRNNMKIINPACLFGIEIKNTHPRHDSRNDIAEAWAEKYHLHKIGGSDCHQLPDAAKCGIITQENVSNITDLVRVLRNDLYTII